MMSANWIRHIITTTLIALSAMCATAATDYSVLEQKASRFYDYGDWNSAVAMYELMLAQKPGTAATYASACVAAGMTGNKEKQASLMERAEKNAIPLDTLLNGVRDRAIKLNEPEIYTGFLSTVKEAQPWSTRMIDVRLLDFYTFRADAPKIISIARELLVATPDNVTFLTALAGAYMQIGECEKATECYTKILSVDSTNINALLNLGNYYASIGNSESALEYLRKAYSLSPTPFLKSLIDRLGVTVK